MHETGADKPVCEEPKTPFPYNECGWDYIDDTSGKLLNNTLVEKARAEEISVIRENLVSGKLSTDPAMRSCLARDGLTSTRETKTNRSTAVDWSCKSTTRQADWSFFTAAKFVDLRNN